MIRLRVTTHSDEEEIIEVEQYDAADITEKRNNNEIQAIQIGNVSYSRIDIKNIKPITDIE